MKNSLFRSSVQLILFVLGMQVLSAAQAGVVVGATRVIFRESDQEATVRLSNEGEYPALVEAWMDNGDASVTPDKVTTPFTLTPPLFRMEPHRGQTLRMLYTREPLPQDRESVFWLNVLEIPPAPKQAEGEVKNMLQFAFRSRIKVFFRPKSLTSSVIKAPEQLRWNWVADGAGSVCMLEADNPTAFHITINALEIKTSSQRIQADSGMVAPFSKMRFAMKGLTSCKPANADISFSIINDYGGTTAYSGVVHE
ncbi:molecular chaperone [Undibacterium rugosum]|nr:fimbria/pilus periplasmic chaperone [Undibacterium rugosum]